MLGIVSIISYLFMPLADIRPMRFRKAGISQETTEKGKALLKEAYQINGHNLLDSTVTYHIVLKDSWQGIMGAFGNPWPEDEVRVRFSSTARIYDDVEAVFLDGPQAGEEWHYAAGVTFRAIDGEKMPVENEDLAFILKTYKFLFEFYAKIQEADIIAWIDDKKREGQTYHRIFATWHDFEPNEAYDQYIVWINSEHKRIDFIEYTIREATRFATGVIRYNNFKVVGGINFPFRQTVFFSMEDPDYLHRLSLESMVLENRTSQKP